jgi:hypothetical protein
MLGYGKSVKDLLTLVKIAPSANSLGRMRDEASIQLSYS